MVVEDGGIESSTLLSKSELGWLLGKSNASTTFQYKLLSNIRRKIQVLVDIDLPLLMKNNLLSYELGTGFGADDNASPPGKTCSSLGKAKLPWAIGRCYSASKT
jgi:hypothetical protein